jgi:hypothetical protein
MQSMNRIPDHQHAHLIEKTEIGDALGRERQQRMVPHQVGDHDHEDIADQQAVDRLAHHHRILVDIHQQQHQLAGEQHRRPRRGHDPERQRHIGDAGEISLEKMHHAERAEEGTNADMRAQTEQGREDREIKDSIGDEIDQIDGFKHRRPAPRMRQSRHLVMVEPLRF